MFIVIDSINSEKKKRKEKIKKKKRKSGAAGVRGLRALESLRALRSLKTLGNFRPGAGGCFFERGWGLLTRSLPGLRGCVAVLNLDLMGWRGREGGNFAF